MPRHGLAVTPDRVCVPSAPMAGCQCSPLSGYPCGIPVPFSGSAPLRHREPLTSRFPPSLGSLPLSAAVPRGLFRAAVGEGLLSRLLGGEATPSPASVTAASGELETFPLAGAAPHPRGPREAGGSRVSAEPAGSVGHVRSFVLCFVLFYLPHSLPLPQRGPAEKSLGNSLSRLSLPSACLRARARGKMNSSVKSLTEKLAAH